MSPLRVPQVTDTASSDQAVAASAGRWLMPAAHQVVGEISHGLKSR